MSTAAQRKAWNEAMRSAGAVLPASASVSGGATASSRRGSIASRSRRKRRDNARKSNNLGDGAGGISSLEEKEYRVALHMDMLEGVSDKTTGLDGDDDDEYNEFAELDDDDSEDDVGKRGKKKGKRKRKSAPSAASKKKKNKKSTPAIPKYLKARSLASILMEEASRPDSVARQYVNAKVKRLGSGKTKRVKDGNNNNTTTTTHTNPYPARKFCPVTGLYGEYTTTKTGIPYASLSALEQIHERPPPWMNSNSASSASYWEAVKSLQQSNE